jgi:hypothetical protein
MACKAAFHLTRIAQKGSYPLILLYRVLKPGGRLALSDIVVRGSMPEEIRHSVGLWAGCAADALEETVYETKLERAGFEQVSIEPTRVYSAEDAQEFLMGAGLNAEAVAKAMDETFISGFIRAVKPLEARSRSQNNSRRDQILIFG